MRLAAIDVGTNTVLLLVAEVDGPELTVVADQERFARLGQDVDATGRLAPEAMDRVVARLRECLVVAKDLHADRIVIGATSASRDASNVGELVDRVRRELGLDYRVIGGDLEAELSFRGAMAMLRPVPAAAVVIDVGGGSTEVVGGDADSRAPARVSLDIGSVRLTERYLRRLPAGTRARAAALADTTDALASVPDQLARLRPVVAAAGTGRVAAALAGVSGAGRVATSDVLAWRDRLLRQSARETLALDPELMAGRSDVVAAGLLILGAALERFGVDEFLVTPGGLRHGLALRAAAGDA